MATYLAFRLASLLVAWLPMALGYRAASLVGDLAFWLCAGTRRTVIANLRQALGADAGSEEHLLELARGVFRTGCKNYYELLRMPRLRLSDLEQRVRLHGFEHFLGALARGRGVVLLTAHLGSFESVVQILAARDYNLTVPVEPVQPRLLRDYVTRLRSTHGLKFVPAERGVMRRLVKALRRNEIVGLAIDRDVIGDGVPVEFLGAVTTFQPTAVALARRERCPVVLAFTVRREDNTSDVYIEPAVEMQVSDDERADLVANLCTVLAVLERYIRKYPDQWVAFVPVWPAAGKLRASEAC